MENGKQSLTDRKGSGQMRKKPAKGGGGGFSWGWGGGGGGGGGVRKNRREDRYRRTPVIESILERSVRFGGANKGARDEGEGGEEAACRVIASGGEKRHEPTREPGWVRTNRKMSLFGGNCCSQGTLPLSKG